MIAEYCKVTELEHQASAESNMDYHFSMIRLESVVCICTLWVFLAVFGRFGGDMDGEALDCHFSVLRFLLLYLQSRELNTHATSSRSVDWPPTYTICISCYTPRTKFRPGPNPCSCGIELKSKSPCIELNNQSQRTSTVLRPSGLAIAPILVKIIQAAIKRWYMYSVMTMLDTSNKGNLLIDRQTFEFRVLSWLQYFGFLTVPCRWSSDDALWWSEVALLYTTGVC